MAKGLRAGKARKNEKREREVFGRRLKTEGQRKVLRQVDAWWWKWLDGYDESLREEGGVLEELAQMDRSETGRRLQALQQAALARTTWQHKINAVVKACNTIVARRESPPIDPPKQGWNEPYKLATALIPRPGSPAEFALSPDELEDLKDSFGSHATVFRALYAVADRLAMIQRDPGPWHRACRKNEAANQAERYLVDAGMTAPPPA